MLYLLLQYVRFTKNARENGNWRISEKLYQTGSAE